MSHAYVRDVESRELDRLRVAARSWHSPSEAATLSNLSRRALAVRELRARRKQQELDCSGLRPSLVTSVVGGAAPQQRQHSEQDSAARRILDQAEHSRRRALDNAEAHDWAILIAAMNTIFAETYNRDAKIATALEALVNEEVARRLRIERFAGSSFLEAVVDADRRLRLHARMAKRKKPWIPVHLRVEGQPRAVRERFTAVADRESQMLLSELITPSRLAEATTPTATSLSAFSSDIVALEWANTSPLGCGSYLKPGREQSRSRLHRVQSSRPASPRALRPVETILGEPLVVEVTPPTSGGRQRTLNTIMSEVSGLPTMQSLQFQSDEFPGESVDWREPCNNRRVSIISTASTTSALYPPVRSSEGSRASGASVLQPLILGRRSVASRPVEWCLEDEDLP